MLYIKEGFPEVNEIVKCTVKRIYGNSVFVNLDEYNKEGILIVNEIAPGRIRNIRDYVVENKVIICKVIRVNEKKGHIDVSLRRVPLNIRKEKIEEIKGEEFAEKIYNEVASKLGITKDELFKKTYEDIFEKYNTVFSCLKSIVEGEESINIFTKLNDKEKKAFLEVIKEMIKPKEIVLKKNFKLYSFDKYGLDKIKSILTDAIKNVGYKNVSIVYLSAGKYQVKIIHTDNKEASKILDKFFDFLEKNSKKYNVNFEFNEKNK